MPFDYRDSDVSDAAILQAAARDENAFGELYDRFGARIHSLALRMTPDQGAAEDATQEVFTKVWTAAPSFDPAGPASANTWIMAVTQHHLIDLMRKQRLRDGTDIRPAAGATSETVTEDEALARIDACDLRCTLDYLPLTELEVFMLAFYGDRTHSEIAELLSIPIGTVKTRMYQGSRRLREHLQGSEDV